MKYLSAPSTLVLGLALAGWAAAAAPARAEGDAAAIPLVSHHATYKLTLVKSTGAKAPEAVDGLLSYDFTGSACEGYSTTLRQMTALQPQEGEARVSEMQTASFEGGDAHEYRFKVASTDAGDAQPEVDGAARKAGDGNVSLSLDRPKAEKMDLPAGVLFPTEHMKKVLATAEAGKKLLSASVFDGSDTGKKVFTTLTVVGNRIDTPPPEKAAQNPALLTMPRWPVTISYFDAAKGDSAPDYVLSFDLYQNGISRALKLDYGDFVLAGELTDLQLKPAQACAK